MNTERSFIIEVVQAFLDGGFESEEKDAQMLEKLHELLPDPEFERFLFWGPEGPEHPEYESFSAEQIVDKAMAYKPIIL